MKIQRILIIGFIALVAGVLFNQIHPSGIPLRYLFRPIAADGQSGKGIILADSAYVLWAEGTALFIDTRSGDDFNLDHIPGSMNIPLDQIQPEMMIDLNAHPNNIIVYDQEGNLEKMTFFLSAVDFPGKKQVFMLYGGYFSWLGLGYPMQEGEFYE